VIQPDLSYILHPIISFRERQSEEKQENFVVIANCRETYGSVVFNSVLIQGQKQVRKSPKALGMICWTSYHNQCAAFRHSQHSHDFRCAPCLGNYSSKIYSSCELVLLSSAISTLRSHTDNLPASYFSRNYGSAKAAVTSFDSLTCTSEFQNSRRPYMSSI
jgi:hypothetical protein